MYRKDLVALFLSLSALPACAQSDFAQSDFAAERELMVEQVIQLAELTGSETGRPQFADRVIEALRTVPRHAFVPSPSAAPQLRTAQLPDTGEQVGPGCASHRRGDDRHVLQCGESGSGLQAGREIRRDCDTA